MVSEGHLASLSAIKRVRLKWLVDSNEQLLQAQARKYGIPHASQQFTDALKDPEVGVIYICLPHYLHGRVALDALKAGKHVVCEKPLAMNAAEADQMIAAASSAGRCLFVSEDHRFAPENILTRRLLAEGKIGRPTLCTAAFIGNEIQRMNDPNNWKGTLDKAGGGVIIDNGFHILDTLISFLGPVESVQAIGKRLVVTAQNKEEDTATISLAFVGGAVANLALTFGASFCGFPEGYQGAGIRYDIFGTQGALHLVNEEHGPVLELVTAEGRMCMTGEMVKQNLPPDTPLNIDEHFVHCLLDRVAPVVTARDGRAVMRVIDGCYESIRTGRLVRVA